MTIVTVPPKMSGSDMRKIPASITHVIACLRHQTPSRPGGSIVSRHCSAVAASEHFCKLFSRTVGYRDHAIISLDGFDDRYYDDPRVHTLGAFASADHPIYNLSVSPRQFFNNYVGV